MPQAENYYPAGMFVDYGAKWVSGIDPAAGAANDIYGWSAHTMAPSFEYYNAALSRFEYAANQVVNGPDPILMANASSVRGMSTDDIAAINQAAIAQGKSPHDVWGVLPGIPKGSAADNFLQGLTKGGANKTAGQAVNPDTELGGKVATFFTNGIVALLAVLILAIAAFSVIVPKDARSSLIKAALV